MTLMSLVAYRFGRVEFQILNICYCFFSAGAVKKSKQIFEIQHVQIDELPRTQIYTVHTTFILFPALQLAVEMALLAGYYL